MLLLGLGVALGVQLLCAQTKAPVLVELFTSEGCSSCPPADAMLAELDKTYSQNEVILLSFHVDYWDRLGWRDPWSSPDATKRQYRYAAWFGEDGVYTPQAVVNGKRGLVGSRRSELFSAINNERGRTPTAQITLEAGRYRVANAQLEVWLAAVQARTESQVRRGENAGRQLVHVHVVRALQRLPNQKDAGWQALPADLPTGATHWVIWVQDPSNGVVMDVARLPTL